MHLPLCEHSGYFRFGTTADKAVLDMCFLFFGVNRSGIAESLLVCMDLTLKKNIYIWYIYFLERWERGSEGEREGEASL